LATSISEIKGVELLENRSFIGSFLETDNFSSNELRQFLLNTYNVQESSITGFERFLGEFLPLQKEHLIISDELLSLLIEYYTAAYVTMNFRKPFTDDFK
ncbi:21053_t:CDS:1, partial [Dentiscutata erythropus]